ncbi:MAG: hypothetical protein EAZ15_10155 [Sphingobacteriales bacterium]|nr:MAG: hypothetical protein EAZ15_10155 [Sphingobacteriales bacterium]
MLCYKIALIICNLNYQLLPKPPNQLPQNRYYHHQYSKLSLKCVTENYHDWYYTVQKSVISEQIASVKHLVNYCC